MGRQTKIGLDYFPKWKPHWITENRFSNINFSVKYKALRNSSSGFISKKEVRDYIFKRDGYKCYLCGCRTNLQIDHVNSVLSAAMGESLISELNTKENLKTICKKCNCSKTP